MLRMRVAMAAMFAMVLSIGLGLTTARPAHAGEPLVNVTIGDIQTGDILSNNTVELNVAANIAVNVCGQQVQTAIVAQEILQTGFFRCENEQDLQFFEGTLLDP